MSDLMDDLISRDDVYNVLKKVNIREMPIYVFDKLWNGVRDLPSAESDSKWIPVSEALPEDMDRLLATIVRPNGEKRVRSGHYYKGLFMMDNGDTWNETNKEILAWMPLAEPYRGDRTA